MVHRDDIGEAAKRMDGGRLRTTFEVNYLKTVLGYGERVRELGRVRFWDSDSLLVVTNRRLLISDVGLARQPRIESFNRGEVSVEWQEPVMGEKARFLIRGGEREIVVGGISPKDGSRIIAELRQPPTEGSSSWNMPRGATIVLWGIPLSVALAFWSWRAAVIAAPALGVALMIRQRLSPTSKRDRPELSRFVRVSRRGRRRALWALTPVLVVAGTCSAIVHMEGPTIQDALEDGGNSRGVVPFEEGKSAGGGSARGNLAKDHDFVASIESYSVNEGVMDLSISLRNSSGNKGRVRCLIEAVSPGLYRAWSNRTIVLSGGETRVLGETLSFNTEEAGEKSRPPTISCWAG